MILNWIVILILGHVWSEAHSLWSDGIGEYVADLWNLIDFTSNSFFLAWIFLRAVAWYIVQVIDLLLYRYR